MIILGEGEEGCSAKSMEKIRSLAQASASASAKASAMARAVFDMTDDCFKGSSATYHVKFTINIRSYHTSFLFSEHPASRPHTFSFIFFLPLTCIVYDVLQKCIAGPVSTDDQQCICGEKGRGLDVPDPKSSGPLIMGGEGVAEDEFPWQAGVKIDGVGLRGGATIISPSYVLSAGHLVLWAEGLPINDETQNIFDEDLPKLSVIVGSRDWNGNETQRRGVKSVKMHPKYNEVGTTRVEYDFVLLELDSPLQFSNKMKPACPDTEKCRT